MELPARCFQQSYDFLARVAVRVSSGLICKDDSGFCRKGLGNSDSLLLAPESLLGFRVQLVRKSESIRDFIKIELIHCPAVQFYR